MSNVTLYATFWFFGLLVFGAICADQECHADDPLVVATVIDSETGKPIPQFHVLAGVPYDRVSKDSTATWQPHTIRAANDGKFAWPSQRSYRTFRLRFESDGYKPAITDWIYKDGGQQTITIKLEPDPGITGRVQTADGKPAAGATVAIAMPNRTIRLSAGKIQGADKPLPKKLSDRWRLPLIVKTDEQGNYQIPTEPTTDGLYFALIEKQPALAERPRTSSEQQP